MIQVQEQAVRIYKMSHVPLQLQQLGHEGSVGSSISGHKLSIVYYGNSDSRSTNTRVYVQFFFLIETLQD